MGARDLARAILESGETRFSGHAYDRMEESELSEADVINTLRFGHVRNDGRSITFEKGSWRYTVQTGKMAAVVVFRSETVMVVVTCWRNEQ